MLIEKDQSSLVIIDVQEKLVAVMPKPHKFINNIIKLQKAAKILKINTLISEQYPKGLGSTYNLIKDNFFNETIQIKKTNFSIPVKNYPLIPNEQIVICGIEAHVCVLQTAIELADKKKKVYVVQDAIASRNDKDYLTALGRLDKHSNIQIVSCEMVLFEWLRTSDHSKFKTISQLIK